MPTKVWCPLYCFHYVSFFRLSPIANSRSQLWYWFKNKQRGEERKGSHYLLLLTPLSPSLLLCPYLHPPIPYLLPPLLQPLPPLFPSPPFAPPLAASPSPSCCPAPPSHHPWSASPHVRWCRGAWTSAQSVPTWYCRAEGRWPPWMAPGPGWPPLVTSSSSAPLPPLPPPLHSCPPMLTCMWYAALCTSCTLSPSTPPGAPHTPCPNQPHRGLLAHLTPIDAAAAGLERELHRPLLPCLPLLLRVLGAWSSCAGICGGQPWCVHLL